MVVGEDFGVKVLGRGVKQGARYRGNLRNRAFEIEGSDGAGIYGEHWPNHVGYASTRCFLEECGGWP